MTVTAAPRALLVTHTQEEPPAQVLSDRGGQETAGLQDRSQVGGWGG